MVLDEQALPLTRAWCIFEVLQTLLLQKTDSGFAGLLFCTSTGVLNSGEGSIDVCLNLAKRIAELDLEKAGASNHHDKAMISEQVIKQLGDFNVMNQLLRKNLAETMIEAQRNCNRDFEQILKRLEPEDVQEGDQIDGAARGHGTKEDLAELKRICYSF